MSNTGICRIVQYVIKGQLLDLSANSTEALYLITCTPAESAGFDIILISEDAGLKVQIKKKNSQCLSEILGCLRSCFKSVEL